MVAQAALAAIEKAVLQGAGGAVPLGVCNAGVETLAGANLTWQSAVGVQKTLCAANVPDSRLRWVAGATARETLMQRERITGSGRAIWEGGMLADVAAVASPYAPAADAVLGDWSHVVVGLWGGGIELRVDPSGGFNVGQISVQAAAMVDVAVVQPAAFVRVSAIS
jgi:HK97 family phage major capsid protein